ncbi:MAG TPA: SCO family protein [Bacillota bacterium]|nr:SCO family protein [Bacillota bacterium]
MKYPNKKYILPFLLISIFIIMSACSGEKTYEGDLDLEIEDFSFENQDGDTVSKSDLDGQFWVADFIFTNCTSVCPPMTSNKASLQKLLKEEGLEDEVKLISFSVDPDRDTPEALKEYGETRGIEFTNVDFLTGYEYDDIVDFSLDSFMSALSEEPDTDQINHTVSFFIVAPNGKAITRFDGTTHENMQEIVDYIKEKK